MGCQDRRTAKLCPGNGEERTLGIALPFRHNAIYIFCRLSITPAEQRVQLPRPVHILPQTKVPKEKSIVAE